MHTTVLDATEDIAWLRDMHCPALPNDIMFVILYGNEDAPEKVEAWREANPHYQCPPAYVWENSGTDAAFPITHQMSSSPELASPSPVAHQMPPSLAISSY